MRMDKQVLRKHYTRSVDIVSIVEDDLDHFSSSTGTRLKDRKILTKSKIVYTITVGESSMEKLFEELEKITKQAKKLNHYVDMYTPIRPGSVKFGMRVTIQGPIKLNTYTQYRALKKSKPLLKPTFKDALNAAKKLNDE